MEGPTVDWIADDSLTPAEKLARFEALKPEATVGPSCVNCGKVNASYPVQVDRNLILHACGLCVAMLYSLAARMNSPMVSDD